jgi:hypothetical protein
VLYSFETRFLVARGSIDDTISILTSTSNLSLGNFLKVPLASRFELTGAPTSPRYTRKRHGSHTEKFIE